MRGISTLELAALSRELSALKGFHVDKFYELADGAFRLRLSRQGERIDLQCVLGITFNATKYVEAAEQPTSFALAVRKRIAGAVVDAVSQYNEDRILLVRLLKGGAAVNMVVEMFGKGNLVLADEDMKIVLAYRIHDFKDRSVRPGAAYAPPKNASIAISALQGGPELLEGLAAQAQSNLSIAAFLSRNVNIGTPYIEDAILACGMDPKSAISAQRQSVKCIWERLREAAAAAERPQFIAYEDNGALIDYSIMPLKKYSAMEQRSFATMQELLDEFFYATMPKEHVQENRLAKELAASIEKQKLAIAAMEESASVNRAAGRKIFELLNQINALIAYAREHRRATLEELQAQFPDLSITALDLKSKTVRVNI